MKTKIVSHNELKGGDDTCQGRSQSSGIGQAPNQAPITAPCAGRQSINSKGPFGLREWYQTSISTHSKTLAQINQTLFR